MPTDLLIRIREAETAAAARVTAAHEQAEKRRRELADELARWRAQAEQAAQAEAEQRLQTLRRRAQAEATALRDEGRRQAEALAHRLEERIPIAARRIVAFILPPLAAEQRETEDTKLPQLLSAPPSSSPPPPSSS